MNRKLLLAIMSVFFLVFIYFLPVNGLSREEDTAKWTFLVYLDCDNNLESEGIADMNEMEAVGSTDDVNIVVQMDRWDSTSDDDDRTNGDWTDARRFLVEKDTDRNEISTMETEILGEVNMGDPETLVDFVVWGMENYPAENYAVVLWDHGGAFWGVCWDEGIPGEEGYDNLNMTEIEYAMEEIYLYRGSERIELLGFDACLMAQMAVLYQVREFSSVVCASGFSEPGGGWPYTEILDPLTKNPSINERELSQIIVDEYVRSYPEPVDQLATGISMAAFDMTRMNNVVITLDRFAEEMAKGTYDMGLDYLFQIYRARNRAQSYDMVNLAQYDITGYPMYDVIDFTYELESAIISSFPKNTEILALCREVRNSIQDDFIIKAKTDGLHGDARGLTMYFPNKEQNALEFRQLPTEYDVSYEETDFAREHLWNEFLMAFYRIEPIRDAPPVVTIVGPEFNQTYGWDEERAEIFGTAYDKEEIKSVEIRVDDGEWLVLPSQGGQGKITWRYNLNLQDLNAGQHRIDVRATDLVHVTEPVYTLISIQEPPKEDHGGFTVPYLLIQIILVIFIIGMFAFGVIIYKGRKDD